jgi:hypothetical protein
VKPLTATELLEVWEYSLNQTLLQKTLHLLSLACPDIDSDSIAKLSIGERDSRLLLFREWMFGSRLSNVADCPRCSERSEWEINIGDIRLQSSHNQISSKEFTFEVDDFRIRFRLPNSVDISEVIVNSAEETDPLTLLSRCILEAHCKDKAFSVDNLPDHVLKALNHRMEEEDPQADIKMTLTCPYCSHKWDAQFDIASYLWTEIDNWAERTLLSIHKLAKAYGWSEQNILNISPVRRQFYLRLANYE